MADWKEPKSDYKAEDQVTPDIFNNIAENEKHLKEISCKVEKKVKSGTTTTISSIVFVEE